MPTPQEQAQMLRLQQLTGKRVHLRPWESVQMFQVTDQSVRVKIETFDVQVLVREDRYKSHGIRGILFCKNEHGKWVEEFDEVLWDNDFEPYTFERIGRRKTADEVQEQREWEKLCAHPGTAKTPLDSYERILDPFFRSTPKMERHY